MIRLIIISLSTSGKIDTNKNNLFPFFSFPREPCPFRGLALGWAVS